MAPPPPAHGPRRRLSVRPLRPEIHPRLLELYCGIGGIAAAVGGSAEVAAALDIDRLGLAVYRANFPHPTRAVNLDSVSAGELAAFDADVWTFAPPCQPYTRRGRGRDDDDPRARSLLALLGSIAEVRPPYLFLENVPGFAGSRMHGRLREALAATRYSVEERLLCPSELGVPNRRRRFYLVAAGPDVEPLRTEMLPGAVPGSGDPPVRGPRPAPPLATCLDRRPEPGLEVDPDTVGRYRRALDVVRGDDPDAITACFTSAYGRSPVRSGSYLALGPAAAEPPRLRRFSPREVLRLLGYPESYRLPPELPRANAWRLAGNSLSLAPVRSMLAALPPLAGLTAGVAAGVTGARGR